VARQTSGGTVSWYLADHLGTVRDLINNSGVIADHVDFSAFGTVLGETSPTNGGRFTGFAMLERDSVTGLNLAVYREENPGTGRWDSHDPIKFVAGDINLYRYAKNEPTSGFDPLGLSGESAQGMTPDHNQPRPGGFILPPDPTGLPPGWVIDPTHKYPHGTRYRGPGGDYLDWHPAKPGKPTSTWEGTDHWHHNGGKRHLPPGTPIPIKKPPTAIRIKLPDPKTTTVTVVCVGVLYGIYRGVRILPSLAPPFWWTLPLNAATP
jgi:RHS repeat-associated protein